MDWSLETIPHVLVSEKKLCCYYCLSLISRFCILLLLTSSSKPVKADKSPTQYLALLHGSIQRTLQTAKSSNHVCRAPAGESNRKATLLCIHPSYAQQAPGKGCAGVYPETGAESGHSEDEPHAWCCSHMPVIAKSDDLVSLQQLESCTSKRQILESVIGRWAQHQAWVACRSAVHAVLCSES